MLQFGFVVDAELLHTNHSKKDNTQEKRTNSVFVQPNLQQCTSKIHTLFGGVLLCWHWLAFCVMANDTVLQALHTVLQFLQQIHKYTVIATWLFTATSPAGNVGSWGRTELSNAWKIKVWLFITYSKKSLKYYYFLPVLSCRDYSKHRLCICENRLKKWGT